MGTGTSDATGRSPIRDRPPIETGRALALLADGDVELTGRMPYSSNVTFLVDVAHDGLEAQAIYKPVRGERPLWDFPSGLAHREAGAFLIDQALDVTGDGALDTVISLTDGGEVLAILSGVTAEINDDDFVAVA